MLTAFYELPPELYGATSCPLNSHLLVHLADYVRLWGPLWTHSAFGFESINGHINSMIHSKHRIADQLVFCIDVSNTLNTIVDKLVFQESEQTLDFLDPSPVRRKNMSELTPGTYSRNSTVIQPVTRGAKGNPNRFPRHLCTQLEY